MLKKVYTSRGQAEGDRGTDGEGSKGGGGRAAERGAIERDDDVAHFNPAARRLRVRLGLGLGLGLGVIG